MAKAERRESELSGSVRDFLVAQGYTVRSEVKGCDLTAVRGDELIIVELKRGFTVDLLIQAVERQRTADSVYVAIPVEGETPHRHSKRWRGMETLLKRLELGMIVVTFPNVGDPQVTVLLHPIREAKPRNRPKQRKAILREIAGRSDDYNVGGVTRRAILTAYREQAIYIALCLERNGPMTPASLRALGASPKTQTILNRNVYGWFERLDRGVYGVRATVYASLCTDWPRLVARFEGRPEETVTLPAPVQTLSDVSAG